MRIFERKGKRGSTWYIDYWNKGQRIMEAIGPDRRLAELAAKKREMEIFEGVFFPKKQQSKIKLRDLAQEYMEKYSKRVKRSWTRDVTSLNKLLPVFGDKYLDDITPRSIENYRIKREQEGVKPSTINREHALLKAMYSKAMDWGMAKENPAKRVRLAKEIPRTRFLTTEEVHSLVAAAENKWAPYMKTIIIMAVNTGMRRGEILNLRWEDVDFARRVLQVKKTKNDQPREVPMTDWLFDALCDWRKKSQKRLDNGFVFSNNNGHPLTKFYKAFHVALKKANIRDFRFHDLRHTFASHMRMAGLDILEIKELGGWKTLQMVDRYSHITTEHKRTSMMVFESHLHPHIEANSKQITSGSRKSLVPR